ncbi:MAG: hypothetical protein PHS34_07715 [Candidatus Omnitrophica bacterium]|nr:hypothetical protein [Candidatus Omnitrophota bacterium]MDD5551129.1 hypothetical protein [Candidatus Omnitrophota bacterium]
MSNIDLFKKAVREHRTVGSGVITKDNFGSVKFKPKEIKLVLGPKIARGQNVEVYKPKGLNELYARKDLCLKVFTNSKEVWGHPRGVGRSPILESTIVQNLMALRNFAPRVYDIVLINGKTAQVTKFITGRGGRVKISDERFHIDPMEIQTGYNFIGGKLVDWQGSVFKDFKAYKEKILKKAITGVSNRGAGVGAYQSHPVFEGLRDTEERLRKYKLPDFRGKTVLDIGCNYGMISRAVCDRGAKRVVGIDWPEVVAISQELAFLDGYFNIDFIGADIKGFTKEKLKSATDIDKFDIHLFLAMENWVGWPEFVKNCDTLVYEGHGENRPFKIYDYTKQNTN